MLTTEKEAQALSYVVWGNFTKGDLSQATSQRLKHLGPAWNKYRRELDRARPALGAAWAVLSGMSESDPVWNHRSRISTRQGEKGVDYEFMGTVKEILGFCCIWVQDA